MASSSDLLRMRLASQLIEREAEPRAATPPDVVRQLLAMQAQDYAGALWAVSLRCAPGTTVADVERAIEERRIVRTWPMRGTLHFVSAEDVRWLLALLAPRVAPAWNRRHQALGLAESDFARAGELFTAALSGGRQRTRSEMLALLEANGISTEGQRGYHVLGWLSQRGLLCLGPMSGAQQTFVLLDEWVPRDATPAGNGPDERAEALGRLAERYYAGHGPATLDDLARWGRITKADAGVGIERARSALGEVEVGAVTHWLVNDRARSCGAARTPASGAHLLPAFDEYYLGYGDRTALLGEYHDRYAASVASNGMLRPTVVIDGRVVGTWRRKTKRACVEIAVLPFRTLASGERRSVLGAADRYGEFLGREPVVEFGDR